MSRKYRLKEGEAVPEGVARIARGRIDHALDELRGASDSSPEDAVHEARKDMKKLRALLRLVRGDLGDKAFRRENAVFRDAGRELAGVRDADVMLATLEALQERYPGELSEKAAGDLRQAVEAHKIRTAAGARSHASDAAIEMLEGARRRVSDWPLERDGFDAVEDGLRRVYRQGRRAWRAAEADPSTEALHEWR
jgi:CHAD domain-containing protein